MAVKKSKKNYNLVFSLHLKDSAFTAVKRDFKL